MGDYPDYTQLFQLVGSDIMVPIDIQGAYIMLPVDIQAQYATLEISIVAQTVEYLTIDIAAQSIGFLSINLAASAITLNINITSITGGVTFNIGTVTGTVKVNLTASAIILDINIKNITAGVTFNIGNISGPFNIFIGTIQTVGIWMQPEWAAKDEKQKYFYLASALLTRHDLDWISYLVPAAKTLYITNFSGVAEARNAADADLQQNIWAKIEDETAVEYLLDIGGNVGFTTSPPVPIKIPGGHTVLFLVENIGNHDLWASVTAYAYEV